MASTHQLRRPGTALDDVRDALQAAGHSIRPRGPEAFMASCPLHTDHSPSLSVGWRENTRAGRGGAVLLHCFSCQAPAADIAAALGLRLADLFDNPAPASRASAAARRTAARRPGELTGARTAAGAHHRAPRTRRAPVATGPGLHLPHPRRHTSAAGHSRRMHLHRPAPQTVPAALPRRTPMGVPQAATASPRCCTGPTQFRPPPRPAHGYGSPKARKTPTPSPRWAGWPPPTPKEPPTSPPNWSTHFAGLQRRHRRRPRPRRLPAGDQPV